MTLLNDATKTNICFVCMYGTATQFFREEFIEFLNERNMGELFEIRSSGACYIDTSHGEMYKQEVENIETADVLVPLTECLLMLLQNRCVLNYHIDGNETTSCLIQDKRIISLSELSSSTSFLSPMCYSTLFPLLMEKLEQMERNNQLVKGGDENSDRKSLLKQMNQLIPKSGFPAWLRTERRQLNKRRVEKLTEKQVYDILCGNTSATHE